MIRVVAALILNDNRLLICQRRRNDSFPLKWEFPGGKIRAGESPAQALARELEEELGVVADVGREVYRARHRYAEHSEEIELTFFAARVDPAAIRNLAFEQMVWVGLKSLRQYDFLPADRQLVERLASGAITLK